MKCPKCKGEMEKGYIINAMWRNNRDVIGGVGRTIESHKCKKCGFLENYALEK